MDNGNNATELFCVIPVIQLYSNMVQFFDCRFIWKSYVNFPFTEFMFVMVKDTYLVNQLCDYNAKVP